VYSWHRLGSFFQALLARELFVAYPRFVDDLFSVDCVRAGARADAAAQDAGARAQELLELTGWELEPAKRVRCANEATMLGVECSSRPGELVFEIGCAERDKWLTTVQVALQHDYLRPAEARRLAGRLTWARGAAFGKGARAYLAALHWQAHRRAGSLTTRVWTALRWWDCFLREVPQKKHSSSP
jgi:hypothetical protein